jgi:hypothetical protein
LYRHESFFGTHHIREENRDSIPRVSDWRTLWRVSSSKSLIFFQGDQEFAQLREIILIKLVAKSQYKPLDAI